MQMSEIRFLKNKFLFINIPSILTALLPLFLITGPFLADLAVTLCAILFIANTIANRFENFKQYYVSKFFLIFISFWITAVISSILSSNIFYSLQTSFFYIRFGFFVLSTLFLLRNNPKFIYFFFYVMFFCFVILILDAFIQFFLGKNIFGWGIIANRISSFFGEELILGSYISRLLPLFFAIFIFIVQKKTIKFLKYYFILIFILSEVLIFISGERSSFFYLNLSAFFILFLSTDYKKMRIGILFSSFFIILIITMFYPEYKYRMIDFTIKQMERHEHSDSRNYHIFTSEHENLYKSAILMFKENKIMGIGTKLFRLNCGKKEFFVSSNSCSTHPHNTYIQLLSEMGILGFFQIFTLFLVLVYFSIKHIFYKIIKRNNFFNDFQIALLSGMLITLWPFVPTGNFFGNWISIVYYLPLAFFIFSFDRDIFPGNKKL